MYMKKTNKKKKQNLKSLSVMLKYLKPYRFKVIVLTLIIFISELCFVATGYLNGKSVEELTLGNIKLAVLFMLAYGAIEMFGSLIWNFSSNALSRMQTTAAHKMTEDVYLKIMYLPAKAFEKIKSGKLINIITSDTEQIVGSVQQLISIIARVINTVIVFIYILIEAPIICLEIVFFLVVYYFINKYFKKKLKKIREDTKKDYDNLSSISNESIHGVREIKTLGIIKNVFADVKDIVKKLDKHNKTEYNTETLYDAASTILCVSLEIGSFITAIILVGMGQTSVAFMVAMTWYIYRFTNLVYNITSFTKTLERLSVSMDRIAEILDNKLYKDVEFGVSEVNGNGVVEFKGVTFKYPNESRLVLDNINIKFENNKKIAIVGASGEGKSTIFNLITRLFDPTKGTITIDGVNIKKLTEKSLRQNVSIIRQEPFIFNRTIKENFELIDPKVNLESIRKYCKLASIDDYIMSLPKQYNTLLGEGGVNLSGGQKQRLAIARTLLKRSKIILFDEATSALDNESQEIVKDTIDNLVEDHTIIIVAHRLTTIVNADVIYVIDKGKVIAEGTHEELLKNCKEYQKLYKKENSITK